MGLVVHRPKSNFLSVHVRWWLPWDGAFQDKNNSSVSPLNFERRQPFRERIIREVSEELYLR